MCASVAEVRRKAEACGMVFRDLGRGHVRVLSGPVNVDYWPNSKKQTVYCKETKRKVTNCTPADFIKFAVQQKDLYEQYRPGSSGTGSNLRRRIRPKETNEDTGLSYRVVKKNGRIYTVGVNYEAERGKVVDT